MRVLSFQSKEVLRSLLKNKIYKPDLTFSRERRDYDRDIEQLGGNAPIWCFTPKSGEFTLDDFKDGNLFERYRCEMSLGTEGLRNFRMLELEIDESRLKLGLTHNAYDYAKVFSEIRLEDLCAVYSIGYADWYHAKVKLLYKYKDNVLFENGLVCGKRHYIVFKNVSEKAIIEDLDEETEESVLASKGVKVLYLGKEILSFIDKKESLPESILQELDLHNSTVAIYYSKDKRGFMPFSAKVVVDLLNSLDSESSSENLKGMGLF